MLEPSHFEEQEVNEGSGRQRVRQHFEEEVSVHG